MPLLTPETTGIVVVSLLLVWLALALVWWLADLELNKLHQRPLWLMRLWITRMRRVVKWIWMRDQCW